MDSFKDVLEAAQAYCKTQMAEPTYNLYIDGLEPISFEDSSHITLSVRNDFICKIVTDRYLGLLKEAFKTVLGFDVDITLVVPSTPPHEVVLAQQYEANPASPQGNYEFTFENFIKGPSNQFAFAAAQAVAANPSGAYNPLFIYGGSGLGKTSGKGHKGAKARSGGGKRPGFEGGQMPLARRLPKFGFNNIFATQYAIVNVADLEAAFNAGDVVDTEALKAKGLVKKTLDGVKVLGNGELTKALTVKAAAYSASAKEKIEKAGGKAEVM